MPRNKSQKANRRIYKTVGMLPHEWELFETLRGAKNDVTAPEDRLSTKNLILQLIHNWVWSVSLDYKRDGSNELSPFGSKAVRHVSVD